MTKPFAALVLALACAGCAATSPEPAAGSPITLRLWPGDAATASAAPAERTLPARGDDVLRITDISEPSLTVYRPERAERPEAGPAVVVFPGGGYSILAIDKEGTEVAAWLNELGVTAVVVRYRVPGDREGAFRDAARAVRLVRHHAAAWGIDPERVGVLGFSAGGHLAARLSAPATAPEGVALDQVDEHPSRPDLCVLVYPAYLAKPGAAGLADELAPSADTPATFIVHTEDDARFVEGSLRYERTLGQAGVPCTLQLYPTGGHGYGLRPSKQPVSDWPARCAAWLAEHGFLGT